MKKITILICLGLSFMANTCLSAQTYAVSEKIRALNEKIEKIRKEKTGTYASDQIEKSKDSILRSQQAMESGNQAIAEQHLQLAELKLAYAQILADERESAEKLATRKAELKMLEEKIDGFLHGKGQ